jgi:hypothetical protein
MVRSFLAQGGQASAKVNVFQSRPLPPDCHPPTPIKRLICLHSSLHSVYLRIVPSRLDLKREFPTGLLSLMIATFHTTNKDIACGGVKTGPWQRALGSDTPPRLGKWETLFENQEKIL